jgi:hypothetical protein
VAVRAPLAELVPIRHPLLLHLRQEAASHKAAARAARSAWTSGDKRQAV